MARSGEVSVLGTDLAHRRGPGEDAVTAHPQSLALLRAHTDTIFAVLGDHIVRAHYLPV